MIIDFSSRLPAFPAQLFRDEQDDKTPHHDTDPVQLSGPEFIAFIFPHLSMPMRGPKCKLGYHRVFNLILWVLYTGMQWKCMPVPRANDGTALIHYTTNYKVFAKWANDGAYQAFVASVRHLAEQHHLDLTILHGDGTNTVAKKGGDGIGYSGHKHQSGEKIIAIGNNGFVSRRSHPSTKPIRTSARGVEHAKTRRAAGRKSTARISISMAG